jgi:hypothetical protein
MPPATRSSFLPTFRLCASFPALSSVDFLLPGGTPIGNGVAGPTAWKEVVQSCLVELDIPIPDGPHEGMMAGLP